MNSLHINGTTELDAGRIAEEFNKFLISVGVRASCGSWSNYKSAESRERERIQPDSIFQFQDIDKAFVQI